MIPLPDRGGFLFPAPYNTVGIRVTNADDGDILPRTYAYWQNVNSHAGGTTMRVFLGTSRGPQFWDIDLRTHAVTPKGPIFPPGHILSASTAEGWYWDTFNSNMLYCSDDEHLYRYHVHESRLETVVDITPFTAWMGAHALRQWHSSHDSTIHSATALKVVADGAWPKLGTVVYDEDGTCGKWAWYEARGTLDESQVDKSGRWLVIKEDDDNRIVDLKTGHEQVVTDQDGAAGHSDNGFGYVVGADNWQQLATWRLRDFASGATHVVYESAWDDQVLHVSHCNARPRPAQIQWVLGSGPCKDLILIPLDGSMTCRHVAPSMCTYPTSNPYDYFPKANLDPHGDHALWTRYADGRFDAFMVQIPEQEG